MAMIFRKYRGVTRDDQWVVGVGTAIFLAICIFYFWQRSITNNGLIDFEDIPSRKIVFQVEVNTAPWPEFSNLPGIGEKLARQIVDHREQFGPFESTDQLIDVSGIGPSKLEAIQPFLSITSNQAKVLKEQR